VPVHIVRRVLSLLLAWRDGCRLGLAAIALVLGCNGLQTAAAEGDTRTISLHHVHTDEDITITYKRDGHYVPEALKKISWLLRDWRRNEAIAIDPHLIDVLWQVQRDLDAKGTIYVICGYRSPQTNTMLRNTTDGVAEFSQHILGKAIDFYIPGVPLKKLFELGLRLQDGGIGFYPTSGSPFVHLDVGRVRHWPAVSRQELVRIFPHGRTVHIPSDGRPLPGYALALADIEARGNEPSAASLHAARIAGLLNGEPHNGKPRTLLASLFGAGKNDQADVAVTGSIGKTAQPAQQPADVPLPRRQPAPVKMAAAAPAASSSEAKPANWSPISLALARITATPLPLPVSLSQDEGPAEQALAYATEAGPELNPRRAALPETLKPVALPRPASIPPATSIVVKQPRGRPALVQTRRDIELRAPFSDPWLRAAILTPDLRHYMTTMLIGARDYRSLAMFLRKPSSSVTMTFSADPNLGLAANSFSGRAAVFLATTTFSRTHTAWLQ
jgi:uncharacterized protein YcbK (DUF882 family)